MKTPKMMLITNIINPKYVAWRNYAGNVFDTRGIAAALTTNGGGNREPMILEVYGDTMQEPRADAARGKIPINGGWWIDAYNMVVSPIAGTIKARINHNNLYFVTELYEEQDIAQPRTRRDVQDNQGQLPQGECG